jgi:hypothetical protein
LPVLPAGTAAKDGATLPVEISLSPVPTASESFVLVVIRDATETGRRDDLLDLARARWPTSRISPGICSIVWLITCSRSG